MRPHGRFFHIHLRRQIKGGKSEIFLYIFVFSYPGKYVKFKKAILFCYVLHL